MNLFGKEITLAILDMDGTLIDSTGIWAEIDNEFFKKRGYDSVPKEYAQEIVHMGLEKGAIMTVEKYGVDGDTPESVKKEWRDASLFQYTHKIQLKHFAREFLQFLKYNKVILALATANDAELYEPCLARLDIGKYFDLTKGKISLEELNNYPLLFQKMPSNARAYLNNYLKSNNTNLKPQLEVVSYNLIMDFFIKITIHWTITTKILI